MAGHSEGLLLSISVELNNLTPKKPLVFCLVSVTVKFRVGVSVGFRTKDSQFYWGRKVKNSPPKS